MTGIEGGGEFVPEPVPEPIVEATPEAPPEVIPEPAAAEPMPEPAPVEPVAEAPAGVDGDVLAEAAAPEGGIDTARAEDAASRKITEELQERLSEAGVDAPGETVATGNLSANPEQLAGELAAVRAHGEQRAAFLAEQARAAEAMEADLDQDFADEADALEADWREREAAEAPEPVAQLDAEAESRVGDELQRDELAASAAAEMEGRLELSDIGEAAQSEADIAEFLNSTHPQELVEQTTPPHDIPLPHQNEIPAAPDPLLVTTLFGAHLAQKVGNAFKRS